MRQLKNLLFFCSVIFSWTVNADDLSLTSKVSHKKSYLGASYEFSQFTADRGDIVGSGGRIYFLHSFTNNFSAQIYLSAALNNQGETQNSFTGVGGTMYYTLFGKSYLQKKEIYLSSQLVATETIEPTPTLLAGAGISQYFFNGNEGVYSASGFNLALSYSFTFYKIRWEALAKYNLLGAGSASVTGTNFAFGFAIPL